jgi:hypothetical protein
MTTMTTLRRLVFAFLALHAAASEACRVPPAEQLIGIDEQLGQAMDVAVGQVIGATPLGEGLVEYRFLVLEQLAGTPQKVFTVMGGPAERNDKDATFHGHADFAFWARGGGRTMNGLDCVIHPGFIVGDTYLVFLGSAPTWRSFEKIEMVDGIVNPDDKWLAYGFQRIVTPDDLDRQALAAQHAPADLLFRAGRLADEFDRIVQGGLRAPDAQFEATLREAAEVHAALQAWRGSNR